MTDARARLGRATSNAFKVLFGLAAVIAAGATYLAITDSSPGAAAQPGLIWLLIANLILIAGIATVLGVRVYQLVKENKETNGGARLRLRIIFLFSLAAAIPTVIVAGFLAIMINRSVEGWFSTPVTNIVQGGRDAARAAMNDLRLEAEKEAKGIFNDIAAAPPPAGDQLPINDLASYLQQRSELRGVFGRVHAFDGSGGTVFEFADLDGAAPPAKQPTASDWDVARSGSINIREDSDGAIRGFFMVPHFNNVFVQVSRIIPATVSAQFAQADASLKAFELAQQRREALSTVLVLSYVEAALLMLLGTAWLGMTAAASIAAPIGALAGAARAVRDGDLSVRMLKPADRDEIADLADAFNEMTDRLARQTAALDRGRIDAETRSAFIEAVLAGVEAGVIRVDSNLKVTIANASAQQVLGFVYKPGAANDLAQVAPEFVAAARRSIETEQSVDTSYKRTSDDGGTLHLQVRVAPEDGRAGAVITFHDTTRLVLGQRQAAWRDVARRIAHEIRNPLTPIQLSAERLRRRFSSQITTDRETFEKCTDTITRQVADIGRMVEEFSGFARMPKPTFGEFNLIDMAQAVAFAQRMATPAIAVSVNAPAEPIVILGDERMLAQAVTNVVKNAAEAVERELQSGGAKFGSVTIDIFEDGEEVQMSIRDNGPGFPVQDRERLLEPYVTTRKNGVGLGLAIVTRIVEDHGGRIWLGDNDMASKGARVDIRLPVQPKPLEEPVAYAGEGVA